MKKFLLIAILALATVPAFAQSGAVSAAAESGAGASVAASLDLLPGLDLTARVGMHSAFLGGLSATLATADINRRLHLDFGVDVQAGSAGGRFLLASGPFVSVPVYRQYSVGAGFHLNSSGRGSSVYFAVSRSFGRGAVTLPARRIGTPGLEGIFIPVGDGQ